MTAIHPWLALAMTGLGVAHPQTKEDPVLAAIRADDLSELRRLVQERPERLEAKGGDPGQSRPLVTAIRWRRRAMVRWMLERGAEFNAPDDGRAPLLWASMTGDEDLVELLLQRGARADATDARGRTALHLAAEYGHSSVVRLLGRRDTDSFTRDALGRTPWHAAAAGGHWETLGELHSSRREEEALPADRYGWTPLHLVAAHGHRAQPPSKLGALLYLATREDAPNRIDAATLSGKTALHFAAARGDLRLVEALLAKGANPSRADARGWTARDYLERGDHARARRALTRGAASRASAIPSASKPREASPIVLLTHLLQMPGGGGDERWRGGTELVIEPDGRACFALEPHTWWHGYESRKLDDGEMRALLLEIEETGILDLPHADMTGPDIGGTQMTLSIGGRRIAHTWAEFGDFGANQDPDTLEVQQAWLLVRRRLLEAWPLE
jgi:ankyrin repeat protein